MSYGVVIARFQVADLTDGHHAILTAAAEANDGNLLVLLGDCTQKPSKRYPLPFYIRAQMVSTAYPFALVMPIMDVPPCDKTWSQAVDELIETVLPKQTVILYGGRDSFIDQYMGRHDCQFVSAACPVSGTAQRNYWKDNTINSMGFRAGMLHAAALHEAWNLSGT